MPKSVLDKIDKDIKTLESIVSLKDNGTTCAIGTIGAGAAVTLEYAHAQSIQGIYKNNAQTNSTLNWTDYYDSTGNQTKPLPEEVVTNGKFFEGQYISPFINFVLEAGVDIFAAYNLMDTYLQYKQATSKSEKLKKGMWLGIHGITALLSKLAWTDLGYGEVTTKTYSGLTQGEEVYGNSYNNGVIISGLALLLEGASAFNSVYKKTNFDKTFKKCLKDIGSLPRGDDSNINNLDHNNNIERLSRVIFSKYPELNDKEAFVPYFGDASATVPVPQDLTQAKLEQVITGIYDNETLNKIKSELFNAGFNGVNDFNDLFSVYLSGKLEKV